MKVLKVLGWSASSAFVAGLLAVIASPDLELSPGVMTLVPLVNTFLVAIYSWLKNNKP